MINDISTNFCQHVLPRVHCPILFVWSLQKSQRSCMCIDLCSGKLKLVILSLAAFIVVSAVFLGGSIYIWMQLIVVWSKAFNFFHSADDMKKTMAWAIFSIGDNNCYIVCTPPPPPPPGVMGKGEGGWAIVQNIYIGATHMKLGFWVGIGTLDGVIFFRWDLKTPCIKK